MFDFRNFQQMDPEEIKAKAHLAEIDKLCCLIADDVRENNDIKAH